MNCAAAPTDQPFHPKSADPNRDADFDSTVLNVDGIESRWGDDGRSLPSIGVVVDQVRELPIDHSKFHRMMVGREVVDVLDGVLDGQWHVVAVRRLPSQSEVAVLSSVEVKALQLVGVRQVLSLVLGRLDIDGYLRGLGIDSESAHDFLNITDIGLMAAFQASTCARLRAGLERAAINEGIDVLPLDLQSAVVSPANGERATANAFGMCFAAIELIGSLDSELNLVERLGRVLEDAPDAISPLSSCTCVRGE